jgi:hypothetical protein
MTAPKDSGLSVRIDDPRAIKEGVDYAIREAIARELGKDPGALARAVADAALARNSYGKSPFGQALDGMIQAEAKAAVNDLIASQAAEIRAAVTERIRALFRPETLADAIVRSFGERLAEGLYVSASITVAPRTPGDPDDER